MGRFATIADDANRPQPGVRHSPLWSHAAHLGGRILNGTCQARGSEAMFAPGGATFVGKLVPMRTQKTTRFASIHAALAVMKGPVLGRQAPELGRKTVAPYQS